MLERLRKLFLPSSVHTVMVEYFTDRNSSFTIISSIHATREGAELAAQKLRTAFSAGGALANSLQLLHSKANVIIGEQELNP